MGGFFVFGGVFWSAAVLIWSSFHKTSHPAEERRMGHPALYFCWWREEEIEEKHFVAALFWMMQEKRSGGECSVSKFVIGGEA